MEWVFYPNLEKISQVQSKRPCNIVVSKKFNDVWINPSVGTVKNDFPVLKS